MLRYYLACFDISDDRNRRRVSNMLLGYGDRVQKSVFELALKHEADLKQLRQEIQPWMATGDDLRFYYLPKESRKGSCDQQGQALKVFPAFILI